MDDAYIIDSNCRQFPIRGVNELRRSWHPAYWFAPSAAVLVEYNLDDPVQLSLDQVKATIVDLVCSNDWFQQGGESEQSFRGAFASMQTIENVMENISFYGEWQG